MYSLNVPGITIKFQTIIIIIIIYIRLYTTYMLMLNAIWTANNFFNADLKKKL